LRGSRCQRDHVSEPSRQRLAADSRWPAGHQPILFNTKNHFPYDKARWFGTFARDLIDAVSLSPQRALREL
jgi:hypothetical protein